MTVLFPLVQYGEEASDTMWCPEFFISAHVDVVSVSDAETQLAPILEATVVAASRVVDLIYTQQPTVGFPGGLPCMKQCTLRIEGQEHRLNHMRYDGRGPMVVGWPSASRSDIEGALAGGAGRSAPGLLVAQASHYAMGNPTASKSAAVLLAAIACEVRVKTLLLNRATAAQQPLLGLLLPKDKQSKLSMPDIVKQLLPLIVQRSLVQEDQPLYDRYLYLSRARNDFAHAAQQISEQEAWRHVTTARQFLSWLDTC